MLVVSLTVVASRIHQLPDVVESLACQSTRPDKVLIHYSREPWHLDSGITLQPLLTTDLDVEWVEVPNYGSSRKYLFAIRKYQNTDAVIVLVDDDIIWRKDVLGTLLFHLGEEDRVVTTRGWSDYEIIQDGMVQQFQRGPIIVGHKVNQPTEVRVASSGWATVFRPDQVDSRVFDERLHSEYCIRYSDEVFLSAMLRPRKYVVPFTRRFFKKVPVQSKLCRAPETIEAKAKQVQLLAGLTDAFVDLAGESLKAAVR